MSLLSCSETSIRIIRILFWLWSFKLGNHSEVSWRVPLPFTARSLRKTVTDVVWRVIVSWRSLRRVLLAGGWIIDELAMGSWDLAAAIEVSSFARYSRSFFLALDRHSSRNLACAFVPLIAYAKHDVLRSITVAVYRYPLLCVYTVHTTRDSAKSPFVKFSSAMYLGCRISRLVGNTHTVFDPREEYLRYSFR